MALVHSAHKAVYHSAHLLGLCYHITVHGAASISSSGGGTSMFITTTTSRRLRVSLCRIKAGLRSIHVVQQVAVGSIPSWRPLHTRFVPAVGAAALTAPLPPATVAMAPHATTAVAVPMLVPPAA